MGNSYILLHKPSENKLAALVIINWSKCLAGPAASQTDMICFLLFNFTLNSVSFAF